MYEIAGNMVKGELAKLIVIRFFQVAYYQDLAYNDGKKGVGGSSIEYRNKKCSKCSKRYGTV